MFQKLGRSILVESSEVYRLRVANLWIEQFFASEEEKDVVVAKIEKLLSAVLDMNVEVSMNELYIYFFKRPELGIPRDARYLEYTSDMNELQNAFLSSSSFFEHVEYSPLEKNKVIFVSQPRDSNTITLSRASRCSIIRDIVHCLCQTHRLQRDTVVALQHMTLVRMDDGELPVFLSYLSRAIQTPGLSVLHVPLGKQRTKK